jgi:hypothetical protein
MIKAVNRSSTAGFTTLMGWPRGVRHDLIEDVGELNLVFVPVTFPMWGVQTTNLRLRVWASRPTTHACGGDPFRNTPST